MGNFDLGQTSLVHLIRVCYNMFDVAAIGALRAVGQSIGKESKNDLKLIEGEIQEVQPGIFGLETCPFADSIAAYKECCGNLPKEFKSLADYANQQGQAWVSAFCGIHQAIREQRIGDSYQQIGCRSGKDSSIADQDILSLDEAMKLLENYACVYAK